MSQVHDVLSVLEEKPAGAEEKPADWEDVLNCLGHDFFDWDIITDSDTEISTDNSTDKDLGMSGDSITEEKPAISAARKKARRHAARKKARRQKTLRRRAAKKGGSFANREKLIRRGLKMMSAFHCFKRTRWHQSFSDHTRLERACYNKILGYRIFSIGGSWKVVPKVAHRGIGYKFHLEFKSV